MKCDYCGHDIKNGEKFCDFCGAKLFEVTEAEKKVNENEKVEETKVTTKEKKKLSPGKIIIIVFLVSTIFVGFIGALGFAAFSFIENFKDNGTYEFTDDEFENYFYDKYDEFFDFDNDDGFSYDDSKVKDSDGSFENTDKFKAGKIDYDKNTYTSKFIDLSFQLPVSYSIYDDKKIDQLYYNMNISDDLVENNLFVYDLYAEDSLTGTSIYISCYNADFFDEYKGIDDFNNEVKDSTKSYESKYGMTVEYADDSTIEFNGNEYNQFAARVTGNTVCYQYDFTRFVDGYYVQISITSYDLDTVGTLIDTMNNKKG